MMSIYFLLPITENTGSVINDLPHGIEIKMWTTDIKHTVEQIKMWSL